MYFIVYKTISELEHTILTTLFLPVQKTLTIGALGRGFAVCFHLDVPMVTSLKLSLVVNGNNLTGIGLTPSKTIHFGSLEFIVDRLGRLSLSPYEGDSSAIFV
jgi:hypothetical protein